MRESELQRKCLDWAKARFGRSMLVVNVHGGGYCNKGFPDTLLMMGGRVAAFELKSADTGYRLQEDQKVWQRRFERSGTPHYVPRSLEEFEAQVRKEFGDGACQEREP
ncbi:hypothetical protein VJ923_07150 [Adlercreutzia sp. R25]|uniref:hypothetical protein n=1 Tax=Adlercreutzia shanghongiae TaxID=3111773 RepID=UPI002DBC8A89|nr:hypothetical protein [Adlercreutzia sp. R25]MEC4272930.1 hypothetical protein [Adlercreutzia sp. R25]